MAEIPYALFQGDLPSVHLSVAAFEEKIAPFKTSHVIFLAADVHITDMNQDLEVSLLTHRCFVIVMPQFFCPVSMRWTQILLTHKQNNECRRTSSIGALTVQRVDQKTLCLNEIGFRPTF